MTIQNGQPEVRAQPNIVAVAAALLALAGLLVVAGRHFLTPSSPSLAAEMDLDKHPIPAWITADAKQCQGDIAKLSPEEQQKIRTAYPGQGARTIVMAAFAMQH